MRTRFHQFQKWILSTHGMWMSLILLLALALSSLIFSVYTYKSWVSFQQDSKATEFTKMPTEALIKTNFGEIKIEFDPRSSLAVNQFVRLAKDGFYTGTRIHRIVPGFMIQGGDPNSRNTSLIGEWGKGKATNIIPDEIHADDQMIAGTVAMVSDGTGHASSQFFIVSHEASWLNGHNTIFARVVSGMDVVLQIEQIPTGVTGIPTQEVILQSITIQ